MLHTVDSPAHLVDPDDLSRFLDGGRLRQQDLPRIGASLLAVAFQDEVHPEITYSHALDTMESLPPLRECARVLLKELVKDTPAEGDDYREEIRPYLNIAAGWVALKAIPPIYSAARKVLGGDVFYLSDRVVGGTIDLSATDPSEPGAVTYQTEKIIKFRSMIPDAHDSFVAGSNKSDNSVDPRVVPGMERFRKYALDESADALRLWLPDANTGKSSLNLAGVRSILPEDHDLAFSGSWETREERKEFAANSFDYITTRGIGLVGPMHRRLHEVEERSAEEWRRIIGDAMKVHEKPQTLAGDLGDAYRTGSLIANKFARLIGNALKVGS